MQKHSMANLTQNIINITDHTSNATSYFKLNLYCREWDFQQSLDYSLSKFTYDDDL